VSDVIFILNGVHDFISMQSLVKLNIKNYEKLLKIYFLEVDEFFHIGNKQRCAKHSIAARRAAVALG
jgi:hypothetical protein